MVDIKLEPKITEGRELLKYLDQNGLVPSAFFWFYLPQTNSWRLVISSPSFDSQPSQLSYAIFLNKFRSAQQLTAVGWENITLLPTNDPLMSLLRTAIRTGPLDNSNIRFTSNVVNGVMIEDVLIYRLT